MTYIPSHARLYPTEPKGGKCYIGKTYVGRFFADGRNFTDISKLESLGVSTRARLDRCWGCDRPMISCMSRCEACERQHRVERQREARAQATRLRARPQPCLQCGEPFAAKRTTRRFCSVKCRVAFFRLPAKEKRAKLKALAKPKRMRAKTHFPKVIAAVRAAR